MRIKVSSGKSNNIIKTKPVETKAVTEKVTFIEPKKEDIVITTPVVVEEETLDLDLNLDEYLGLDDEV